MQQDSGWLDEGGRGDTEADNGRILYRGWQAHEMNYCSAARRPTAREISSLLAPHFPIALSRPGPHSRTGNYFPESCRLQRRLEAPARK